MSSTTHVLETSSPVHPSEIEKVPSRNHSTPFPMKFKGVVPQQNGNYGAQIYANHQRIWLGTFKSDIEAALAYDSACIKLRTGDNYRNFQLTNVTVHEPKFQSLHSTDAILTMIRDGSYQSKFAEFLRSREGEHELGMNLTRVHGFGGFSCKLLFQKKLTPSDVSKLNRLVVPKKDAVKYFPVIPENPEENTDSNKVDEVHLLFFDRTMRLWKFRYCYWKSSQSFVFTRGWNRFVKEKGLKANDTIAFFVCERQEKVKDGNFYVIDVSHDAVVPRVAELGQDEVVAKMDGGMDLRLRLGQSSDCELVQEVNERSDEHGFCSEPAGDRKKRVYERSDEHGFCSEPAGDRKKRVKLFGADIN